VSFIVGVVLFALGITVSIALHEFGHLLTAKAFGMKARRYFIGFGKRIWSFRRGETEYGIKALPLGGFVDIAGMTAMDEVKPDEEERAFYRKPVWQRVIVLGAGSFTHFVVGIVVVYLMALSTGLPDPRPAVGAIAECVNDQNPTTGQVQACTPSSRPAPAKVAGLHTGDVVLAVGGTQVSELADLFRKIWSLGNAGVEVPLLVYRDGRTFEVKVPSGDRNRFLKGPSLH
jgi:membrane-associated protease RseP (regulator of RpoE activity)